MISDQEANYIINALSGQNDTESRLADKYDVSIEDIEEVMINAGYERCEACDYWFESSELLDDLGEPVYQCAQCKTYGATNDS